MNILLSNGPALVINGQAVQDNNGLSPPENPVPQIAGELQSTAQNDATKVELNPLLYTEPQAVTNIQQAVNTTADALSAVQSLRDRQEDLTDEASKLSFGKQTTEIATETAAIQSSIQTIASSTTSNGTPLLSQSNTYQYTADWYRSDGTKFSQTTVITTPKTSGLSVALDGGAYFADGPPSSVGYASPLAAATANSEIGKNISVLGLAQNDVQSAQREAAAIQSPLQGSPVAKAPDKPPPIDNFDAAQQVAQQIASAVGAPFFKEQQTKSLIDTITKGLEPENVSSLLDDEA